jgi:hypothetical protein
MKIKFFLATIVVAGITTLNSCKDDEVPVAGVNFELADQEVTESDGSIASFHPEEDEDGVGRLIPVKLVFDIPLAGDAVFNVDVDGSARQTASSSTGELNDFMLEAQGDMLTVDGSKVTVLKGASEAILNVRVYEDYNFEYEQDSELTDDGIPYETVEITLESVVSGPIKLGEALKHVVKILEDDSYIFLDWGVNGTESAGTANLDLLVYINNNYAGRSASTTEPYEFIVLPGGFPSATYGLSYVYKSGLSTDVVNFRSEIANFGGTIKKADGTEGVVFQFAGNYNQANIKDYGTPSATNIPNTNRTQTIVKNGLNFTALTELSVPTTGSRVKPTSAVPMRKLLFSKPTVIRNTVN